MRTRTVAATQVRCRGVLAMSGGAAASVAMEGVEGPGVTSSEGALDLGECGCCLPDSPFRTVRAQFLSCGPATQQFIDIVDTVFPECPVCKGSETCGRGVERSLVRGKVRAALTPALCLRLDLRLWRGLGKPSPCV